MIANDLGLDFAMIHNRLGKLSKKYHFPYVSATHQAFLRGKNKNVLELPKNLMYGKFHIFFEDTFLKIPLGFFLLGVIFNT